MNDAHEMIGDNRCANHVDKIALDHGDLSEGQSVVGEEFMHLFSDGDRTTDDEFHEAVNKLKSCRRKKKVTKNNSGEEVEQSMLHLKSVDHRVRFVGLGVSPLAANGEQGEIDSQNWNNPMNYSPASSYRDSSDSEHVQGNLSDEGHVDVTDKIGFYDPNCDHMKLQFKEGMKFTSPDQFREAVVDYSIAIGADIIWKRSSQLKKEATCRHKSCKWRAYASWHGKKAAFMVKAVGEPHNCPRALCNKQASSKWIAKTFLDRFRYNPNWDLVQMATELKEKYALDVNTKKCYRAREHAAKMLKGTLGDEYNKLRPYIAELKRVDPDGRFDLEVQVEVDENTHKVYFQRFFVGFSCLRRGFLAGCRPMFGLDGCFLKGEVKGMLLSAIGKDGNNQMFPIAWAVVEGENRHSWTWFVQILQEELGLQDGNGWSVISDQHKGLVQTLQECLPHAEHRKCARHIFANWKVKHTHITARKLFWKAVYASNEVEFKEVTTSLSNMQSTQEDKNVYDDFMRAQPEKFCRAFLSKLPKCDSVESNICETFNGCIVKYRELRVIDMLESIRRYMMDRVVVKNELYADLKDLFGPRIRKKIEAHKLESRLCITRPTLNDMFECKVKNLGFVVDLRSKTCSCGYWKLSGIPCIHAVSAISYMRLDINDFVDSYYHVSHVKKAYDYGIPALNGQQAWPSAEGCLINQPKFKTLPGRPKKKRRKEAGELETRPSRTLCGVVIRKNGVVMHCSRCKKDGHNVRSCPGPPTDPEIVAATDTQNTEVRAEVEQFSPAYVQVVVQNLVPATLQSNVVEGRTEKQQSRTGKTVRCGSCQILGHNSRSCLKNRRVQTIQTGETSTRRAVEKDIRVATNGVGVFFGPNTGNAYFVVGSNMNPRACMPMTEPTHTPIPPSTNTTLNK